MIFEKIDVNEIDSIELMDALDDAINIMKVCECAACYDDHDNGPLGWLMNRTNDFMSKLRRRIGSELMQTCELKKNLNSVSLVK